MRPPGPWRGRWGAPPEPGVVGAPVDHPAPAQLRPVSAAVGCSPTSWPTPSAHELRLRRSGWRHPV